MNLAQQIDEYRQLGCDDLIKCSIAHRCVNQLRSASSNATVRCQYDAELDLLYVIVEAKNEDGLSQAAPKIYMPLGTSTQIDMIHMERVQQRLQRVHANVETLSLAMCDGSGTTIYYRMSGGFKEKL